MSNYYGGTITVAGRNLITRLLAGDTIEFTRIIVGSGVMPEGVEPIDMTELVNPIAEATSTVPTVENGVMSIIVEYRNDLNGGLAEGFWLSEFGIYAKTDEFEEVLIYYATLGDSPQPVNAYVDNRIDVRRYPVTIALEVDADVQVSYTPGAFITSHEAEEMLKAFVNAALSDIATTQLVNIYISPDIWMANESDTFPFVADLACAEAQEALFPVIAIHPVSLGTAQNAGISSAVQTLEGIVRFWAQHIPEDGIFATVSLTGQTGATYTGLDWATATDTETMLDEVFE